MEGAEPEPENGLEPLPGLRTGAGGERLALCAPESLVRKRAGFASHHLWVTRYGGAHPESLVRKRAGFASHHLWVTRYKPGELYAAGGYPNQSAGGDGLPHYADETSR